MTRPWPCDRSSGLITAVTRPPAAYHTGSPTRRRVLQNAAPLLVPSRLHLILKLKVCALIGQIQLAVAHTIESRLILCLTKKKRKSLEVEETTIGCKAKGRIVLVKLLGLQSQRVICGLGEGHMEFISSSH